MEQTYEDDPQEEAKDPKVHAVFSPYSPNNVANSVGLR